MYKEILAEIRRHAGLDKSGKRINHDDRPLIITTKELSDREIIEAKSK